MRQDQSEPNLATIKEVASAAGVSTATVSRLLSGTGRVSPQLTRRVMAAVKGLNYQPNDVARALKVKVSRSIGLVIPDIENPYFPSMVRGVEDAAREHDYAVILCNTDGKAEEEERYLNFLCSKRVDGTLFIGGADRCRILDSLPLPVVLLDRRMGGGDYSLVATDNRRGAFMATEYLLRSGRRRIAFIGASRRLSTGDDRADGYASALASYDLPCRSELQFYGDFVFDGGKHGVEELLATGVPFDAVFAANDMIAFGAIETLLARGYRVPDDVAVVGYDDIHMAAWYKPALSTIHQPTYEMGQIAVDILMKRINGPDTGIREVLLEPTLVIRQSS